MTAATTLAQPGWLLLWLLVPITIIVATALRTRRRRYAVRLPATSTLAMAVRTRKRPWHYIPMVLLALGVCAIALALSRPSRVVAIADDSSRVILVMDASRSMLATDVDPSRLDAAKRAAKRFLNAAPEGLRVGLLGFSDAPRTGVPPTTDLGDVRDGIDSLEADGGTATGDAIDAALRQLGNRNRKEDRPPAVIVLLSDGKASLGRDPVEAARDAQRLGVPITTVALGTPEGIVLGPDGSPIAVPPDPDTLRRMSEASGGQAFAVEDSEKLDAIYRNLGSSLATRRERRELAGSAAGLAALLLAGAWLGSVMLRGRVP